MQYDRIFSLIRFSLGGIFLWAFFDKLLGLGFSTPAAKSVVFAAGSPTIGFLSSTTGFFSPVFHWMAGNGVVDFLFMAGLFCIGLSLILGIGLRIAAMSGALMMFLMWLAAFPSKSNPLLDSHIVYLLIFLALGRTPELFVSNTGLRKMWLENPVVQKYPILA